MGAQRRVHAGEGHTSEYRRVCPMQRGAHREHFGIVVCCRGTYIRLCNSNTVHYNHLCWVLTQSISYSSLDALSDLGLMSGLRPVRFLSAAHFVQLWTLAQWGDWLDAAWIKERFTTPTCCNLCHMAHKFLCSFPWAALLISHGPANPPALLFLSPGLPGFSLLSARTGKPAAERRLLGRHPRNCRS